MRRCRSGVDHLPVGDHKDGEQDRPTHRVAGLWPANLRASFLCSFTGQAVGAVAFAHAALLPILYAGWLTDLSFAFSALALSCVGLGILGRRWTRAIAQLRGELQRFAAVMKGISPATATS